MGMRPTLHYPNYLLSTVPGQSGSIGVDRRPYPGRRARGRPGVRPAMELSGGNKTQ